MIIIIFGERQVKDRLVCRGAGNAFVVSSFSLRCECPVRGAAWGTVAWQ